MASYGEHCLQFQETSGGLQLPGIDDSLLNGLHDLLAPGKDPCDFS